MSGAIPCWTCQLHYYIGGAAQQGSWHVQQGMAPLMLCPNDFLLVRVGLTIIKMSLLYMLTTDKHKKACNLTSVLKGYLCAMALRLSETLCCSAASQQVYSAGGNMDGCCIFTRQILQQNCNSVQIELKNIHNILFSIMAKVQMGKKDYINLQM